MPLSKGGNERLWDAVIKEALIEEMEDEIEQFENNLEEHSFSPRFNDKMDRLIRNIGKKEKIQAVEKTLGRVMLTAAAVMGIMFGGLLTQQEVYAAVESVIKEVFSTNDKYTYHGNSENTEFDDSIRLGYVPEGYELRSVYYMGNGNFLTYESIDGNIIEFEYSLADSTSVTIDNERHIKKDININGTTYYLYESIEDNDYNIIIWYDNGYAFDINAQICTDEIIRIAESIKIPNNL